MPIKAKYQQLDFDPEFPLLSEFMSDHDHQDIFYCHWHPNLEIIKVEKGLINLRIDTIQYQVQAGDIIIINPNQIHYGYSETGQYSAVNLVALTYDILKGINSDYTYKKYIRPLVKEKISLPNIIHISEKSLSENKPWINHCFEAVDELLTFTNNKVNGYELGVQSAFLKLIMAFYAGDKFVQNSNKKTTNISEREMAILLYIEKTYTENLSIKQLATAFNLSEDYFYKLFKQITGQTPINYINHLRITHAKNLLKTTDDSISIIGVSSGFDSPSYFCKVFKKLSGMSPKKYRDHLFITNGF